VGVELAEIFHRHGPAYLEKYRSRMPPRHRQAMRAIERCRTEALGGHVYHCPECDEMQYRYHSCRNRHCPKCQHQRTQQWLEKQQEMRLPVANFLLTFTLPDGLRIVARSHSQLIYHLLFRTSAEATQLLSQDPRFVGGQIGMIGVLHTWGRNLAYHPHVHYLVPAGGLAEDGRTWLPSRKGFLVPVKALSKLVRAKFRDALRKHPCFADVPVSVWKQDWVVHCQPVGNGEGALKYLAPYIFRVAISNNRILKLADGEVTFCYKDTDTGKNRRCTLSAEEFIRRFLQHVLPKGFVKVRYYGFFSPGKRHQLASLHQQLHNLLPISSHGHRDQQTDDQALKSAPEELIQCPICGRAMQLHQILRPNRRAPP
jgi:ssDNA-binding Zn-finger/Zn-ribbon topoisomerase 1